MERECEFCKACRALVYCIADAANLCLICDAKVHSANSLSGRHLRTLLCDSCKNQPCVVRCLDHKMFLCHGCNHKLHGIGTVSSDHYRLDMSCYTACPSAKDFAVMWGYDYASLNQYFPMVQRESSFILEQILELEKIQLRKEEADPSPLEIPKQSQERLIDLKQTGNDLIVDFSHLSSSSSLGDSYWENNQLWHQNLQDIGVCVDTICDDDSFNIPEIDLTFRNFEELFGADPDPIQDNNNNNNNIFFVGKSTRNSCETKTFSSQFNNGGGSSQNHYPHNHSEEVISFCSPLYNNARQNAISRLKEKKRARTEEKQA